MGELADMVRGKIQNGEKPAPQGQSRDANEVSEEMSVYRREMVKNATLHDLMGTNKGEGVEQAAPFKALAEMAAAREKANADLLTTLLGKMAEVQKVQPAIGNDPYVRKLEEELKELKNAIAGGREDPFEIYDRMQGALDGYMKRAGFGEVRASSGDVSATIELKKMELTSAQEQRRWEQEMAERRHQWEVENRRWEEEFRLKRMEFYDSKGGKERASGALEDLAGSIAASISAARAGQPMSAAARPAAAHARGFNCEECGHFQPVPDAGATEATCENCGTIYDLRPKDQPAAAPAPTAGNPGTPPKQPAGKPVPAGNGPAEVAEEEA
ncbi:MAG: hypothetical protein ACYDHZ_00630 [Dehalococcoidia bacterium]